MRQSIWSFWKRAGLAALVLGPTLALIAVDVEARRGGGGGPGVRAPRGSIGGGHAMRPPGGGGARPARPAGGPPSGARPPRPGGGVGPVARPPAGGPGGARPPAGRPPLAGPPPGGPRPPPPRPRPPVDPYWGAPLGAAAAVGTAIAIGAIVYSLPPNCRTVVVYGERYRQCGNDYYLPRYEGSTVVYELVPSPY
jgi:hypothetical protein